jgi:hypothetical protein
MNALASNQMNLGTGDVLNAIFLFNVNIANTMGNTVVNDEISEYVVNSDETVSDIGKQYEFHVRRRRMRTSPSKTHIDLSGCHPLDKSIH